MKIINDEKKNSPKKKFSEGVEIIPPFVKIQKFATLNINEEIYDNSIGSSNKYLLDIPKFPKKKKKNPQKCCLFFFFY